MILDISPGWLPRIPNGWIATRVKSEFFDDTTTITTNDLQDLTVSHFSIPAFDFSGEPIVESGSEISSNKTLLKGGELLYSKLNSHKPRVWMIPADEKIKVASTEFIALRKWPASSALNSYFKYLLGSEVFAEYMSCFQTSVTNSHRRISPRDLWQTVVPLPPLVEQQRISTYLETSGRVIGAAIDAKRKQITVLDGIRKSTIQRVVTMGLDASPALRQTGNSWLREVPESWSLVMLKRICDIQTGLTLGKAYEGPLVERPYLRVANVQDGHFDLEDVTTVEVPPEVAARVSLRPGDVLMTEGGDLDKLGRGSVWDGSVPDCLHQNHIFAVRCCSWKLRPKFLAYLTASQYGRDYFEATGKRTTNLAATNSTKVGQFPVPLPSLVVQDELIDYLDDKIATLNAIKAGLEKQIATLIAYRKSLIHECVTGRRRVTESDLARVQSHVA